MPPERVNSILSIPIARKLGQSRAPIHHDRESKKYIDGLSIIDLPVIFGISVFEERRTVLRDADQGINSMAIGDLRPGRAVRGRMLLLRG